MDDVKEFVQEQEQETESILDTYEFSKSLPSSFIEACTDVTNKYAGTTLDDIVLTDAETGETVRLGDIEGKKIIELYSGYCPSCVEDAYYADIFASNFEDEISYFMVSKEKNSKQTENMRNAGYTRPLYYIDGELNPIFSRTFEAGTPSYILVDVENNYLMSTGGRIVDGNYINVFKPFEKFLINESVDSIIDEGGSKTGEPVLGCELC